MRVDPFSFNVRHLLALLAVQAQGSISAGARVAGLSQSALTQAISKVEGQLGCALFVRNANGTELTPEADNVLQRVRSASTHVTDALAVLGADGDRALRSITMAQVKALVFLRDARSFAAAAAAAGVSAPAVHRAVGELEAVVGKPLIDRRGHGLLLNFAGQHLARGFRLALGELQAMVSEVRQGELVTPIALGAMPIARPLIVPTAIARFVKTHPRTRFMVAEGDWQDLTEQLQDGIIDLIVGVVSDQRVSNLVQERWTDDQIVVLGASNHPLATCSQVTVDEMARYPWIVSPPMSPLRLRWEALFANHLRPECPVECESIMVVINLLAQSHFLTLASLRQVELPMQTKRLAQIGSAVAGSSRSVGITMRKNWRPTSIQRQFVKTLEVVASLSDAAPITRVDGYS